jgi:thymidylate synthase (FAD)
MTVKLISFTPDAEKHIAYCARVSNPNNQQSDKFEGLIKYCIKNRHWSIFEQAFMTLEIETSRAIAAQILRHRSFTFQEFSQRYSDTNLISNHIPFPELRKQDLKNRQNSTDDLEGFLKLTLECEIAEHFNASMKLYNRLLEHGVAKESARFVLPLATPTRMYMTGSIRSWITYISLREKNGTQKEHMLIAKDCKKILCEQFPVIAEALGGLETEWEI